MKQFTISLEDINSAFGISAETLTAIAQSYGVSEEQIIIRALTQWAKVEIPDLDLDEPNLTQDQINMLLERRRSIDATNGDNSPSLQDLFRQMSRTQGEADESIAKPEPRNGGHT